MTTGRLLAAAPTPSPAPLDPSKVEPGVIGLAFFLVMLAAVVLLAFSLRGRLRRLDAARQPGGWEAERQETPAHVAPSDSPLAGTGDDPRDRMAGPPQPGGR